MVNDLLAGLPPIVVFLVVAALVTAEAALIAGLVLPAATALIAMGLLANAGVVPIGPAFAVAIFSALLGGNLAFRRGGFVSVPRAERLFARYGPRAIFLGQWVVGARTLMPRLAARSGLSHRAFAVWHTPAAVLWAVWMVGASYAAGASYDVLAARAGRAAGALAVICLIILGLILAGRWLGQNPDLVRPVARFLMSGKRGLPGHPVVAAAVSLGLLTSLAMVLVAVIPPVVRFSGLSATDQSVTAWARSQWTSDGYLFALETATTFIPEVLIAAAVLVSVGRWWRARSGWRGLGEALGPVLPALILAGVLAAAVEPGWRAAETLVLPTAAEFDGQLPAEFGAAVPLDAAAVALATMSAGQTAQVASAAGLLAWLVARGLSWSWQVTVWTVAAVGTVVCAGAWVYLGWSPLSETVAAVVLGGAWAAVNAAVWSGRARVYRGSEREPCRDSRVAECV